MSFIPMDKAGYLKRRFGSIATNNRRRAAKLGVTEHFTDKEFLEKFLSGGCRCFSCRIVEYEITADHIVPLSLGGSNLIENIQPLCDKCNSAKGNVIAGRVATEQGTATDPNSAR